MNEYEYMQRRKHLTLGAIGFVAFCFVANSVKDSTTQQFKTITKMSSTKNHIQLRSVMTNKRLVTKLVMQSKVQSLVDFLVTISRVNKMVVLSVQLSVVCWVMQTVMQLVEHELFVM